MPLYEHVYLARQDVSASQVEALTEKFKALIAEGGGTVGKTEYWGLKTLAYRIKKNRKAHFSLMNIDAPHAALAEMERQMGLDNDVIRFLTLRVREHESEPSAAMQSGRGRDERGGRRGGRPDERPRRRERAAEEPAGDTAPDAPDTPRRKENE